MIASVEGTVGAVAADSLVIEVGGHRVPGVRRAVGPRRRAARARGSSSTPTTSSARTSRRCTGSGPPEELGFFNLLLTVTGVGPEGGAGDRRLAPDGRPPARDPAAGPGGARVDPGHRQEARRAGDLRAQGEGRGGGGGGRRARSAAAAARRPRARSSRRSRRSATRWARRARRRGSRSPRPASARTSRSGSRRRCGRCSATE